MKKVYEKKIHYWDKKKLIQSKRTKNKIKKTFRGKNSIKPEKDKNIKSYWFHDGDNNLKIILAFGIGQRALM